MKLAQVTFTELHEAEGAFGQECIAIAGGVFPKYLIYSYSSKAKTVIFPPEWNIERSLYTPNMNIPEESRHNNSVCQFMFGDFCYIILRYEYIKKIDFVEVEYNPDDFRPNKELVLLTLRVPRRNKARTDRLIKKYQTSGNIVAERSRKISKVISRIGRKDRISQQCLYELAIYKSAWHSFAKELYKENLIPKTERFAILVGGAIFPRQLVNFQKTS